MQKMTIAGLLLALSPLPSLASAQTADSASAGFMTGMIHHHAQALLIAGWIPTHGASSQLRVLGERIVVSQRDEIALMQRWLRERGLPVPEAEYQRHAMAGEHAEHADHHGAGSEMPGMLSPAQLAQLDSLRGTEFERMFLLLMTQHHRGAITMVERLIAAHGGRLDPLVLRMASDISADQSAEIDRMVRMMALLPSPRSNQ